MNYAGTPLLQTTRTASNPEGGAALIELAFVLPLIFLVLGATFELGRYFSHVSWLAQAGYQATLAGGLGSISDNTRIERMRARYAQLRSLHSAGDLANEQLDARVTNNPATGNGGTAIVQISGEFRFSWLNSFFKTLPLRITVTGPILANAQINTGDNDRFCGFAEGTGVDCS